VVCQPIKLLCPVVDDCPDLGEAPARVLQTTLIEQKVCSANSTIRKMGQKYLVMSIRLSMRLWQDEPINVKILSLLT